jgi:hypothetical protein
MTNALGRLERATSSVPSRGVVAITNEHYGSLWQTSIRTIDHANDNRNNFCKSTGGTGPGWYSTSIVLIAEMQPTFWIAIPATFEWRSQ